VVIDKKVWPEFFEKIRYGEKNFELRLGNFDCRPGDLLLLREWDPKTEKYTGRFLLKEASYVFRFRLDEIPFWHKEEINKDGLQIISLKEKAVGCYSLVYNGICPECFGKLRGLNSNNGFDWFCGGCSLYYRLTDDPGLGGYYSFSIKDKGKK